MKLELKGKRKEELWLIKFVINAVEKAQIKFEEKIVANVDDVYEIDLTVDGKKNMYTICTDIDVWATTEEGHEILKYDVFDKEDDIIYAGLWNTSGHEVEFEGDEELDCVWFKEDSNIEDSIPSLIHIDEGGVVLEESLKGANLDEYFTEMATAIQLVDKETEIAVLYISLPSELVPGKVYRFTKVQGEETGFSDRILIIQNNDEEAYSYDALILAEANAVLRMPLEAIKEYEGLAIGNAKEELGIDLKEVMKTYGLK